MTYQKFTKLDSLRPMKSSISAFVGKRWKNDFFIIFYLAFYGGYELFNQYLLGIFSSIFSIPRESTLLADLDSIYNATIIIYFNSKMGPITKKIYFLYVSLGLLFLTAWMFSYAKRSKNTLRMKKISFYFIYIINFVNMTAFLIILHVNQFDYYLLIYIVLTISSW